jgi:hypothetical protein
VERATGDYYTLLIKRVDSVLAALD